MSRTLRCYTNKKLYLWVLNGNDLITETHNKCFNESTRTRVGICACLSDPAGFFGTWLVNTYHQVLNLPTSPTSHLYLFQDTFLQRDIPRKLS